MPLGIGYSPKDPHFHLCIVIFSCTITLCNSVHSIWLTLSLQMNILNSVPRAPIQRGHLVLRLRLKGSLSSPRLVRLTNNEKSYLGLYYVCTVSLSTIGETRQGTFAPCFVFSSHYRLAQVMTQFEKSVLYGEGARSGLGGDVKKVS